MKLATFWRLPLGIAYTPHFGTAPARPSTYQGPDIGFGAMSILPASLADCGLSLSAGCHRKARSQLRLRPLDHNAVRHGERFHALWAPLVGAEVTLQVSVLVVAVVVAFPRA